MKISEEERQKFVEVIVNAHNLLDEQVVILGEALDKMNDVCAALEMVLRSLAKIAQRPAEDLS